MTFFSAIRGLWWVASEVVDAAKQLVAFTPGQDEESPKNERCAREAGSSFPVKHGPGSPHLRRESIAAGATLTPDEAAERLAEYEAGVECLEPQDDCGLGGFNANTHAYGAVLDASELTGAWEPQPLIAPLNADEVLAVRRLLESSAAPGVAPVEAADKDPGVSHSPTPGSQTSLTAGRIAHIREMCQNAIVGDSNVYPHNPLALTDRAWLAQSVLNILDGNIDAQIIAENKAATLGNDLASVHDRAMRQRHNEDREQ